MIFDNGGEFANHINYHLKGFKTYFCNACSPWRKGLTIKKLQKIENLLNNMPRKILVHKTPNQVWNEKLKLASNSLV
jgi:IS30 family transposase